MFGAERVVLGGNAVVNLEKESGWLQPLRLQISKRRIPGAEVSRAMLRTRISGARSFFPNQQDTSRCGLAAFLYRLLKDRHDLYVRYAVALWTDGTFNLRNGRAGKDPVVTPGRGPWRRFYTARSARIGGSLRRSASPRS